jgi:hypothetical protein
MKAIPLTRCSPLIFAFGILMVGCRTEKVSTRPSIGILELKSELSKVEPWGSKQYDKHNWERLISISRQLQTIRDSTVQGLFSEYQNDFEFNSTPTAADSKLFLLNRILFDIPDNLKDSHVLFGNWVRPYGQLFADGWPVDWSGGYPALVSGYLGKQGVSGRYNAAEEFRFLKRKYRYRDLSRFESTL